MSTPFHHPFRIDAPTLSMAAVAAPPNNCLLTSHHLPNDMRFIAVNPADFTHAYILLGNNPQRFGEDLILYLSTVKTFFERNDASGGIKISPNANTDSRRRLSEDLGVALAAYFMVTVFGIEWELISQIPQNSKLSKKRPDFQGYTNSRQRHLFEAKGTTKLPKIESSLSAAMSQVKVYPEQAQSKIAIVSYLSADERFFPSTSFVVDPVALPEEVKPDPVTSGQLHFEKVLQYSGLKQTAKNYISTLAYKLREQHRTEQGAARSVAREVRLEKFQDELRNEFDTESTPRASEVYRYRDSEFVGQYIRNPNSKLEIFLGARRQVLETGIIFKPFVKTERDLIVTGGAITSIFPDGTILSIVGLESNGS